MSHYLYLPEEITDQNKLKFTSEQLQNENLMRKLERLFINEIEFKFDKSQNVMKSQV